MLIEVDVEDRRFIKGLDKWTTDDVITCGVSVWANVLGQVLRGEKKKKKKTASYTGPLSLIRTDTHKIQSSRACQMH